ncbi:MAG: extracellular solute-binding protein [Desulfobacula sp.]|uniref:extracellular solute-binding protein n=1 Tax=Desulfobacula sp. TaxID=2593537 RepID=UPI0025BB074A|nr:extracellular solute-binding protein [Desulfobacula sp.]MCD4722380.1 extracellular solute-binding protein [Desulfobacula sp.]
MKYKKKFLYTFLMCIILSSSGWSKGIQNNVIIYTSHDQIYSEPILDLFEKISGIKVKAVYDVEATKTTGIVNRLIAEKNHPRCDVFWNNENIRTIVLKEKGILQRYISDSAKDIPKGFKDPEGFWTGFAARSRVIIYNKDMVDVDDFPKSIYDFTDRKWNGQVAIANPLFGTTATHAAALFAYLGNAKAISFFQALKENHVIIAQGNSVVKDQVANGELMAGLTDTDDANMAILAGKPIGIVMPDQDGMGTLLIPNTVVLINNCPNPENGKKFIDFLLSKEIESKLAFSSSVQIPVRNDVTKPATTPSFDSIRSMDISYDEIADKMEETAQYIKNYFLR